VLWTWRAGLFDAIDYFQIQCAGDRLERRKTTPVWDQTPNEGGRNVKPDESGSLRAKHLHNLSI